MAGISLSLFIMAMALGITTLWRGVRLGRPSVALGYAHACTALTALVVLGLRVFTGPENLLLNSAFFVFLLAVIGGLFTLAVRGRNEPVMLPLILLHATAAVVAVLLLAAGVAAGG
ncbi:hypothetical protein [Aquisalimonas asiatica]|uniref:Uncharacterized protein n=1 Tax=Aquisalimonas asiatica TaxID=406100 RepID=A0A1H8TFQ6_9GAMM|nr:hypothetical protein [Aquisalimonas asiatica]SEO89665.1 hypothetical protein SAMN04488052_104136 [Aquisalimonas asiatica]